MRRGLSRLAVLGVGLVTMAGAAVTVLAAPAVAAPQCNNARSHLPDSAAGGIWVPAASNGDMNCWMAQGNVSSGVWAMQRALRICYGKNIAIDSRYGPRTAQALFEVQGVIGARQDGEYGPETAGKIKFSSINTDDPRACAWK